MNFLSGGRKGNEGEMLKIYNCNPSRKRELCFIFNFMRRKSGCYFLSPYVAYLSELPRGTGETCWNENVQMCQSGCRLSTVGTAEDSLEINVGSTCRIVHVDPQLVVV